MKKILLTSAALLGLAIGGVVMTTPASACTQGTDCNRTTDGVTFEGNVQLQQPIDVVVCHGYWNLLDVGTLRGRQTKWWAPVMRYNNWYGDLPVVISECKTYSVRPGSELRLYADCVSRLISTGPMNRPGRYVMQ